MVIVSVLTWGGSAIGLGGLFVLSLPVWAAPWTLVTSVYAHLGPGHLLSNALIIAIAGGVVAWSTSRRRFHAFVITTGAASGVVELVVGAVTGGPTAVLGASGAAFALVGYVVTSNAVSASVLDRIPIPPRIAVVAVAVVAASLTALFSAAGSALVAHFTGTVFGLVAGRFQLLRT